MKTAHKLNLLAAALVGALTITSVPTAQAQISRFDALGNLPFAAVYPTAETEPFFNQSWKAGDIEEVK